MTKLPQSNTVAYRAAFHLHKFGPLSRADLFAQVHFGKKRSNREQMLDSAIANGWLIESIHLIDCCPALARHFAGLKADEPKPMGNIATSREPLLSVYERPALRYRTNSKGFRDDIPPFSVRDGQSFRSVPTGGQP